MVLAHTPHASRTVATSKWKLDLEITSGNSFGSLAVEEVSDGDNKDFQSDSSVSSSSDSESGDAHVITNAEVCLDVNSGVNLFLMQKKLADSLPTKTVADRRPATRHQNQNKGSKATAKKCKPAELASLAPSVSKRAQSSVLIMGFLI